MAGLGVMTCRFGWQQEGTPQIVVASDRTARMEQFADPKAPQTVLIRQHCNVFLLMRIRLFQAIEVYW